MSRKFCIINIEVATNLISEDVESSKKDDDGAGDWDLALQAKNRNFNQR